MNEPAPIPEETQVKIATAGFTVALLEQTRAINKGADPTPSEVAVIKKASAAYAENWTTQVERFKSAAVVVKQHCAELAKA